MTLSLLWMCAALAAAVFIAMLYSVATFQHATEDARPKRRVAIEMMWSIVPILIFLIAAAPTFRTLSFGTSD